MNELKCNLSTFFGEVEVCKSVDCHNILCEKFLWRIFKHAFIVFTNYIVKTVVESQIQKHVSSFYTGLASPRPNNFTLVLDDCEHNVKEIILAPFSFTPLTDKCSLFSQIVVWSVVLKVQIALEP